MVVYIYQDTDIELKLKSIKKQMSLTYNARANLKVNEDAKNFGIKIKNGSLRMLTKKNVLCLFGKISPFSSDARRRGLGRRGTRMVITQ